MVWTNNHLESFRPEVSSSRTTQVPRQQVDFKADSLISGFQRTIFGVVPSGNERSFPIVWF